MDKTRMIDHLNDLLKVDHDAINSYEEAIGGIDIEHVRSKLREFQNDHRTHVDSLNQAIRQMGGMPHDKSTIKGFFLKSMTAISARMGNEGAIRAMESNEKLVNQAYAKAAKESWPPDLMNLVKHNYDDEKRHLSFLQQCITQRVWEQQAAHP
ncbi:MAG TPA: PA2169 family four-helix-bundle protein [Vulgatibacter sp.]|nr:PA2169 family four-helix-bundle protein [Vulgatibacter sp.]